MQEGTLRKEIQQNKPFASLGQEALLSLFRTTDLLKRQVSQVVEPRGVTLQQYNVLRILRGAGSGGLPTLAIGERMIEQTPGITRLLDRLESKSLVRRQRSRQDRRQVFCYITPRGLDLLSELDQPILDIDKDGLGMLERDDLRTLIRLLDRIRSQQPSS
ncbi:MAG TPA: MarR family transcriptional regulator [Acidobacteriota bacterium]|nr:MarR family transcriptional regulator [Acidobacteriota bacterium]